MKKRTFSLWVVSMTLGFCFPSGRHSKAETPLPVVGTTTVLKWKDGKQAAFLLEFDDSLITHLEMVIPELVRRGMVGTFYVNPGNAAFKKHRLEWETVVPRTGMVYANHTFTHVGAGSPGQLDEELNRCSQEIDVCFPSAKKSRLVSFGQPGGVPWTVTAEEKNAALAKYHLVERPPFKSCATKEQMLALVDRALATGEMEYNVFHGVGGDWLVTPVDTFTALLDKLDANRARLWITDPLSWHQYVVERAGSTTGVLEAGRDRLRVSVRCTADPGTYDLPLTLATRVEADWKICLVTQGKIQSRVMAANGEIRYDAMPGPDEIIIQPASDR